MRAAAVQFNASEDTPRNLRTADRLVREAADRGATLVLLPEKFNCIGTAEVMLAHAELLDGPTITWARGIARDLGIELVAGSITERIAGRQRAHNTSVLIGGDGEIRAAYRKIHLFDVEVGGLAYRESATEDPGNEVVVADLADGTCVGLTICYDLRFPELFRLLALRGARVLTVPAAFTLATTRDHWEVLLRARAIEDQCFVVASNQIGSYGPGRETGGRSMIIDPWGVVLATAGDADGVIVADLDLDRQDVIRAELPSLANRRPSAYAWPDPVRT